MLFPITVPQLLAGTVHHGQENVVGAISESRCASDVIEKHAGFW